MAPRPPALAALTLCCAGSLWWPCHAEVTVVSDQPLDEFSSFGAGRTRAAQDTCDVPDPVAAGGVDFWSQPALLFILCIALLTTGYFVYGTFLDKMVAPDDSKPTPGVALEDGMDFVPMSDAKVFLIQLLNIAGLGPIFGPIQGAVFGPSAFIWIVLGCIFFGSVADYLVGMMSVRSNGASITTLVGNELGKNVQAFLNVISLVLLVLVGVVFVSGPAGILANLWGGADSQNIWSGIIFVYYIIATLVPVDKVIGRIYPIFGAALIFMTIGLLFATMFSNRPVPDMVPTNSVGTWPYPSIVVTISCGAISGFHATQTPMMARCIMSQGAGKKIFFGAMITEGVIALVWALSPLIYFGGQAELTTALGCAANAGVIVQTMLSNLLGAVGGAFGIVGVVALPITSGDTAFRSARLIVAELSGTVDKQSLVQYRLMIAVPMFAIAFCLTLVDFALIWQYFNFTNQTVAVMALWTGSAFLKRKGKVHFVASVPATILTFFLATYIFKSTEFGTDAIELWIAAICGVVITTGVVVGMAMKLGSLELSTSDETTAEEKERVVALVRDCSSKHFPKV